MKNKRLIWYTAIIALGFSFTFLLPIRIILLDLETYENYEEKYSHFYKPSSPASIHRLNLDIDVGNIKIRYINPPVDYYAKIDIKFEMSGKNLRGKNYTDFFNVTWQMNNSQATLTVDLLSEDWFNPSLWTKNDVNIEVTLRADVIFDIITKIEIGSFEMTALWGVTLGDLLTNVSNGDILYDLSYCLMDGNISANNNVEGFVELRTTDIQCIQNCFWSLKIKSGEVKMDISQEIEMGGNITGFLESYDGFLTIDYNDYTSMVGAWIKMVGKTDNPAPNNYDIGFDSDTPLSGYEFTSYDYPTSSNYNISLFSHTVHHLNHRWYLYSES